MPEGLWGTCRCAYCCGEGTWRNIRYREIFDNFPKSFTRSPTIPGVCDVAGLLRHLFGGRIVLSPNRSRVIRKE